MIRSKLVGFYALIFNEQYCYVGSSVCPVARVRCHIRGCKYGNHYNYKVQQAFDMHGKPRYVFLDSWVSQCKRYETEQAYYNSMTHKYIMLNLIPPAYTVSLHLESEEAYEAFCRQCGLQAFRDKMSEITKQLWQDPEYVRKVKEGLAEAYAKPEVKERHRLATKRARSTPESRAKTSIASKLSAQNPETQRKRSESLRLTLNCPEIRKKMSELQYDIQNRPEQKLKKSKSLRKWHSNIDNNLKMCAASNTSERLQQMSNANRKRFANETERQKQSERLKAAYARPETKLHACAAAQNTRQFLRTYGSAKIFHFRSGYEQYQRWHHILFPAKGGYVNKAVVFIWDTREVVAILDAKDVPEGYRKAKDSHEPLDFSGIISKSKSNKHEYYVT